MEILVDTTDNWSNKVGVTESIDHMFDTKECKQQDVEKFIRESAQKKITWRMQSTLTKNQKVQIGPCPLWVYKKWLKPQGITKRRSQRKVYIDGKKQSCKCVSLYFEEGHFPTLMNDNYHVKRWTSTTARGKERQHKAELSGLTFTYNKRMEWLEVKVDYFVYSKHPTKGWSASE